jgi:DNA-binding CsgD family transcriptional regulator
VNSSVAAPTDDLSPSMDTVLRALVANPDWDIADLSAHLNMAVEEVREELSRLAHLSLAQHDPSDPGHWRAVNPLLSIKSLLTRQENELAAQLRRIGRSRATLVDLMTQYGSGVGSDHSFGVERLEGLAEVRLRLTQLADSAKIEVLAFAPGGPQPAHVLESSRPLDAATLGRGVAMKTIYMDSIRNNAASAAYSRWLTELGGEVRTVASLPLRMVIADASVAVVPLVPENPSAGAVVVHIPGVVAALHSMFTRVWHSAVPLGAPDLSHENGLTSTEMEVIKLLTHGGTDEGLARKLGVSVRTVRRIIADLMTKYDVKTRFQLGKLVGEKGLLIP